MPSMQRDLARYPAMRLQGHEVTPVVRTLQIAWRGGRVEWHRPLAVEVRDGEVVQRIPIQDGTRRAVIALLLGGCVVGLVAAWVERRQPRGESTG